MGIFSNSSDFKYLRENNKIYIDKTQIIELMEESSEYITFLRPRRFGKTLLVSTLFYYYDVKSAPIFDTLFGDLYIGKNSTKNRSSYYILKFNFSKIDIENEISMESAFKSYIFMELQKFIKRYAPENERKQILNEVFGANITISNALDSTLEKICGDIYNYENFRKIYVIIDEYDHFANKLIFSSISTNSVKYKAIVQGEGIVRNFFTSLKGFTGEYIERIFITGILPILLNDIGSGFNIAENCTTKTSFQGSLGFTYDDVRHILKRDNMDYSEYFERITDLYDGLMYAKYPDQNSQNVYNPLMVLNSVKSLVEGIKEIDEELDQSMFSDQNKFDFFLNNQENYINIVKIMNDNEITATYNQTLRLKDLSNPEYLCTILFHYGMLTFKKNDTNFTKYVIPNKVAKKLYFKYFKLYLVENIPSFQKKGEITEINLRMALQGDLQPIVEYFQDHVLNDFSARDSIKMDEKNGKIMLIMLLKSNPYYSILSELELTSSIFRGGFTDLILKKTQFAEESQTTVFEWMLELKHIKITDISELKSKKYRNQLIEHTDDYKYINEHLKVLPKIRSVLQEAKSQLTRYKKTFEDKYPQYKDNKWFKYAILIFVGKDFVVIEIVD